MRFPAVVTGLETAAPLSELRVVRVTWRGGAGRDRERVHDWADLACAPEACRDKLEGPVEYWVLEELGIGRMIRVLEGATQTAPS